MSQVVTLLGGALFGLALATPPGPMNAVIATESVLRGWTAGFRAGLGAMVADRCFFVPAPSAWSPSSSARRASGRRCSLPAAS